VTILGFTGTHLGMTLEQRDSFCKIVQKNFPNLTEFHHGDCIGADLEADAIISTRPDRDNFLIVVHPPVDQKAQAFSWKVHPKSNHKVLDPKPYLIRNHDIVDSCNILIAAPKGFKEELRSGTWATIRYARSKRTQIWYILPNGDIVKTL